MTQATPGFSDDDRVLLRDSLRQLLADHWLQHSAGSAATDHAHSASLWKQLASLGITALGSGGEHGGWREAVLAIEELGRAACPALLIEAVACQRLRALTVDNPAAAVQALLADIGSGTIRPALLLGEHGGDLDAGHVTLDANARLRGEMRFVDGATEATHFIVALGSGTGSRTLAIASATADRLSIESRPGPALSSLASVLFTGAPCQIVNVSGGAPQELAWLLRLGLVARSLGAARRAFDLVLEHSRSRRQFGQAIGQFQALQHKLANGLITLEATALMVSAAAQRIEQCDAHWRWAVASAVAFAAPALRQLELDIQHTFGAIGYAEEHEAPRHFRRVYSDLARLGGARLAREFLAVALLPPESARLPDMDMGARGNALRAEIRSWLAVHWNDAARQRERARPFHERGIDAEFSRLLGAQGWIAASWPQQYGGRGFGPLEQYVLMEEMAHARAPTGAHNVAAEIIGPALIRFGTADQKAHFLPAFRRGELLVSLGYSESEAGSDLSSLRMRAVRDGDEWIIDGEKLWTTRGDVAHYHWLAVRTDPEATPRHAGISIFMVPLATRGITIGTSMAMYGHTFSSVHYSQVRVPDSLRVGDINGGWKVITHAMASERIVMGAYVAAIRALFEDLIRHAVSATRGGCALHDDPLLRDRLGELAAQIEAARQLSVNGVRIAERGGTPSCEAAMSKVYSGELLQRLTLMAIDLLGPAALQGEDGRGVILDGHIEQQLRRSIMMVVGGGSAEIQRNLIAVRGLGLPRQALFTLNATQ